jgi:3-phosphoshikimate 1-carboxyvinyltransferase
MDKRIRACASLRGEIIPPGDKSISHRAIILNSIAEGRAKIDNLCPGVDCQCTIACLQALGVGIKGPEPLGSPHAIKVLGVGSGGLREAQNTLDAGNSATTMRLLAGLLAAQPFLSIITGDDSLRSRPMERLIQPLRLMGAEIWGRQGDSLAPIAIRGGRLRGITYPLPVPSAQLKSALLLAGLWAQGNTVVEEPAPSRDHSERMLQAMGAKMEIDGDRIAIAPMSAPLASLDLRIPGDISAAAYWLVAGAIHPDAQIKVTGCGINTTRTGIIDVLRAMGANLKIEKQRVEGGEPVADLLLKSSDLIATKIDAQIIPRLIDEIPVIAVAASMARGTTVIQDAAELRVKETDRIRTTVDELSKLGIRVEELPEGMVIHGEGRLRGAEVDSRHDHRLAMALAVAALVAEGETVVRNAEAVDMSYPAFWQELEKLGQQ